MTLDLIGGLVREGLFEIGDLTAENARFFRWSTTLEQSLQCIEDVYVTGFDNADHWSWFCWLDLTSQGASVAQPIEDRLRGNRKTSG